MGLTVGEDDRRQSSLGTQSVNVFQKQHGLEAYATKITLKYNEKISMKYIAPLCWS